MSFDFDRIIDRTGTNAIAADGFRDYLFDDGDLELPCPDGQAVPMWVADMAFAVAPVVLEAMRERLDHPILGYTVPLDGELPGSFVGWCERHYGWSPAPEHLVTAAGVVPALYDLMGFMVAPGDKVVTHTPAYEPFESAVTHRGAELVHSPVVRTDTGGFTVDLHDLESKLKDPAARLLLLCHPHNPTGHVWSESELRAMAELCFERGVTIISDEIHCDLLRIGLRHTPLAAFYPGSDRIVTCMSSSKTFNLAGLGLANVVIPNDEMRAAWNDRHFPVVNPVSAAAVTAAFRDGDAWLEQLKRQLDANFAVVREVLDEGLPAARFHIPDATYLAWIDLSAYFPPEENLTRFFAERTGVLVEGGEKFVADGDGHIRVNVAAPRAVVTDAIGRIVAATIDA